MLNMFNFFCLHIGDSRGLNSECTECTLRFILKNSHLVHLKSQKRKERKKGRKEGYSHLADFIFKYFLLTYFYPIYYFGLMENLELNYVNYHLLYFTWR